MRKNNPILYTMSSKNIQYDITNMMVFSVIGIMIKLFFGNTTSSDGMNGPASSAIWGYGVVALSILAIMFITFALASQMHRLTENTFGFVKLLIQNSLPALLMFIILVWLISMNAAYFKQINEGHVASEYAQFSNISTIMIIFQLIVLFKYLKDELMIEQGGAVSQVRLTEALKSQMASITYILTIINLIFVGMMNIVIEFFSTDG